MKLFEIFGRGRDRDTESNWRDQMANQAVERKNMQTSTGTSALSGFWLISQEGKKLAGPFGDAEKAETYKANRTGRIPVNAIVKQL